MKIIDLLNKIANGEEVPKNFIYDDYYWSWCESCEIFESVDELGGSFNLYKYLTTEGNLNDDIEIIDDEEPKKIEKIITYKTNDGDEYFANILKVSKNGEYEITEDVSFVIDKINEIIDYINKGDSNE